MSESIRSEYQLVHVGTTHEYRMLLGANDGYEGGGWLTSAWDLMWDCFA